MPALILTAAGLVAVVCGLIKVQAVDGAMWREKASHRSVAEVCEPAQRGNIYSSDGKILATTIPVCDLYVDLGKPVKTDENGRTVTKDGKPVIEPMISDSLYYAHIDEVCELLAEAVHDTARSALFYKNKLNAEFRKEKPARCMLVQRAIPYSTWDRICAVKGWNRVVVKMKDGKSVIRQTRAHIYGNLCENCIGFKNSENAKRQYTGLEGYYDSVLRGQDGIYECRRLTKGVWLPVEAASVSDTLLKDNQKQVRIDGADIVATIDTRYQDIAETSLRDALKHFGGTESSGCAVLMEAKTGYVLACCNLSWDSIARDYREQPNRNVACSDVYEPGSTFKTVILTAMLCDPKVKIDTAERVRVRYKNFNGRKDGEIKDDHDDWDTLSVKNVIAKSSNVGMCELGWRNYRDRRNELKEQVKKVFPYEVLNLDISAGESKAKVNDLSPDRDFLNYCYGYAQQISAMQIITFYNALANGGKMVKPLFCKAIRQNGIETPMEPVVMREQICDATTIKLLNELLVNVVTNGTGDNIRDNSYGIAGKTGTSQSKYNGQKGVYNASFAGFFPAENPTYTCLVVVKNVVGYGRSAAAPVFKKISDCVVALDKNLENGKIEVGSRNGSKILAMEYRPHRNVKADQVPNCEGMTIREAMAEMHQRGIKVTFSGKGRVVSQSLKAGQSCKKGNKIHFELK